KVKGDWQGKSVANDGSLHIGDEIVLTTTDYFATHSEELRIVDIINDTTIRVEQADEPGGRIRYPHVGHRYNIANALADSPAMKISLAANDIDGTAGLAEGAETRAAVALLRRSIRIVSGGDRADETFADVTNGNSEKHVPANPHYQFGGHMVFRQGFEKLQIQGVEFHQLGVGGRLGHYPVHFHMARKVPNETFIKDSSVSESMTRWFVVHQTQNVTLQRNVGWKSIGHGYFLETGTETDNRFFSNIGILARAAIEGPTNPRNVPGILSSNIPEGEIRFRSDVRIPTVFWISNGWNDFVGNMAAGAGSCGACFWLHATQNNTDMVEVPKSHMQHQEWTGYASRQGRLSPLRSFVKNYCSSAMISFMSVSDAPGLCDMVADQPGAPETWKMVPVPSYAPDSGRGHEMMYYPDVSGFRNPTVCPPGDDTCKIETVAPCSTDKAIYNCTLTVLDHYTSSFNYAETNFAAVWLRKDGWFLYDHSFLSDVQSAGLSFVSGGDYSKSSSPSGYWMIASNSVFVGATQPQVGEKGYNPWADVRGPHAADVSDPSKSTGLGCTRGPGPQGHQFCINASEGLGFHLANWAPNQRMFSIYDGPAFQDGNAYLNTPVSPCESATAKDDTACMYKDVLGVRKFTNDGKNEQGSDVFKKGAAYLPNAAIGWKQPNGFYYPPAFNSRNIVFDKVDIRHYVVSPVFLRGTYRSDQSRQNEIFADVAGNTGLFNNFTDVDRQTVLNDDDGAVTGFVNSLSVNDDPFFGAPVQVAECLSNPGVTPAFACDGKDRQSAAPPSARTSPYEYVTTAIYPDCAANTTNDGACGSSLVTEPPDCKGANDPPGCNSNRKELQPMRGGDWSRDCGNPACFGVPLYRQRLTDRSGDGSGREWQLWSSSTYGCDKDADKDICDFPFIRMAGTGTWQRSTLTAYNGVYYIDTTRAPFKQPDRNGRKIWGQHDDPALGLPNDPSAAYVECAERRDFPNFVCSPRSVNVFKAGETYNVLFVFATERLKQTYQLYVGGEDGRKFNPATDVNGTLVVADGYHFGIKHFTLPTDPKDKYFDAYLISSKTGARDEANGDVLEVVVDFSKLPAKIDGKDYSLNPKAPANKDAMCRPAAFCSWDGTKPAGKTGCGCSLKATDPLAVYNPKLLEVCAETCNAWGTKALDCPDAGCLGFSFKLPQGFKAVGQYKRPPPKPFPAWKPPFTAAAKPLAGTCFYDAAHTPEIGSKTCPVPNIADLDGLKPALATAPTMR
ncbi:MAG: hypothetical protein JSS43_10705, partial [Proteobacteria bacterium]|nr:hypothetical protein [Pseudomonadota bacterium]